MNRVWNFSAGPAALPLPVLERAQRDMLDWNGSGASVMEQSHRGQRFAAMAEQAESDLRALLGVNDDYAVLFLQGGATQHFAQIPMNLAGPGDSADYIVKQLKAFQAGTRQNDQMSIMAQGLSDDDMANLAAWYSSIKVTATMPH